jgi:hypothetical protein
VNYKLVAMDWLTVKLKAGRIVPALSTTTTVIAGLQTIELVKVLKGVPLEAHKNAFLNLALPLLHLSEPGAPEKVKLTSELAVTVWDRWEVQVGEQDTVQVLLDKLRDKYQLVPRDVFADTEPVYLAKLLEQEGKKKEREAKLASRLL